MMLLAHTKERIIQRRKITCQQQRRHACLVRLKTKSNNVTHQANVIPDILRQTILRTLHREQRFSRIPSPLFSLVLVRTHPLNAALHITDAGQIFVELHFVRGTDLATQRQRMVLYTIQHARVAESATVFKQAVKCQRRIHLVRHRRITGLPGDMRTIGIREICFMEARHGPLTGQHHAGLRRLLPDLIGQHLVDCDTAVDDRAFPDRHPG